MTNDNVGNLTSISNSDSTINMSYDVLGRVTSVNTFAGILSKSISYSYDKNGNRTSMSSSDVGTINYEYDALNRLVRMNTPSGQVMFGYDELSRRTAMMLPNGLETLYTYDSASQLTVIASPLAGVAISYTYDSAGNRTTMTDSAGTHDYTYDNLYRLIDAQHPTGSGIENESYSYDSVGNRTASHLSSSYSYDSANRLLYDETYNYQYDNNGNMTRRTEVLNAQNYEEYSYNAENQLTGYTKYLAGVEATTAVYKYDPLGRRISKVVTTSDSPLTTYYVYDNEDIIAEYDETGTLIKTYLHGPGIDEPLVMKKNGNDYFYSADVLGSIRAITDSNKNIINSYNYDSFGIPKNWNESISNAYTYTAREYNTESGDYYYRTRYYSSNTGKFISEDVIQKHFIDYPQEFNLYSYARNNPIRYRDPNGMFSVEGCCPENLIKGIRDWGSMYADYTISNAKLRRCVKKSLKKGKIICSKDTTSPEGCGNKNILGFSSVGSLKKPIRTFTLCVSNLDSSVSGRKLALHEFAHGCGWTHGDGGGVPYGGGYAN